MPLIELDGEPLEYTLIYRPNKKRLTLRVGWDGTIRVSAPLGVAIETIEEFLRQKAKWILVKRTEFARLRASVPQKTYSPGDVFHFLGEPYPLQIKETFTGTPGSLRLTEGHFYAEINPSWDAETRRERLSHLFREWYHRAGYHWALHRIAVYGEKLRCFPEKVAIRDQKTRWGSCTSKGAIYLNWRIFMAPPHVVDYVIVHELAHLRHFDHSPRFWELVESALPTYADAKAWLKEYGLTLDL
ncbi:MAG: M48 family metallopeptidase [Kyrpidia tusciae]|nr:SprT family zinc-dependent metalloprotease [Kyrpidia tusciae]MBE3552490.1 M48 family metallopeptidase [Kyrpidia tusciae]